MAQYANIAILHRNPDYSSYEYEQNTPTATYLSSCISVFRSMVSTPYVRRILVQLATNIDRTQASTWYRQRLSIQQVVDTFIDIIRTTFPPVWDETLANPAIMGHHPRGQWQGQFNPRDQAICLNALHVRRFIAAAGKRAEFRTYHFKFVNLFVHEVAGHLLVTFLTQGRINTPKRFGAGLPDFHPENEGESGRYLENLLFGGNLEFYRDSEQPVGHPGTPYIVNASGGFRIPQSSIDETVDSNFVLPYRLSNCAVNVDRLQPMVRFGAVPAHFAPPSAGSTRHNLAARGYRIRVDKDSLVARVPFDPRIRLQAA